MVVVLLSGLVVDVVAMDVDVEVDVVAAVDPVVEATVVVVGRVVDGVVCPVVVVCLVVVVVWRVVVVRRVVVVCPVVVERLVEGAALVVFELIVGGRVELVTWPVEVIEAGNDDAATVVEDPPDGVIAGAEPATGAAVDWQPGRSAPGPEQLVVSGPTTTDVSTSSAKVGSRSAGRREVAVMGCESDPLPGRRVTAVLSVLLIARSVLGSSNNPSLPSGFTGSSTLSAGSEAAGPAGSPVSSLTTSTSDPSRCPVRGNETATTRPSRHSPIRARSPCRRNSGSTRSRPVARKVRKRSIALGGSPPLHPRWARLLQNRDRRVRGDRTSQRQWCGIVEQRRRVGDGVRASTGPCAVGSQDGELVEGDLIGRDEVRRQIV